MTYDTTGDACTLDEVIDALQYIDSDVRETWLNMGMAVKAEFGEGGFDAWNTWSQGYDKYKSADANAVWKSIRGGSIGIGTLFKAAIDNGWKPRKVERTADELSRLRAEQVTRRKQREQQEKHEAEIKKQLQDKVAAVAWAIWQRLEPATTENSEYLTRKQIAPHGVRVVHYGVLVVTDTKAGTVYEIRGSDNIRAFYNDNPHKTKPDHLSIHHYKQHYLAVPILNSAGVLRSLQFITPAGTKLFMKAGEKSGNYYLIGEHIPPAPLCMAEGFATGASINEATGWAVAITWDSQNLKKVGPNLRTVYGEAEMLVCGDDDVDTDGNPGRAHADDAAGLIKGRSVFPVFLESA